MSLPIDRHVVTALASRTFRALVESPVAYVVSIFFFGFVGAIYGGNYFRMGQASVTDVMNVAPWALWFVIPALTMGLLAEELRSGTYESLSTLPIRDWEIVIGKFLGFAALALLLILGLAFYAFVAWVTSTPGIGIDIGATIGTLAALYLLCLAYGAFGLFASSLTRSQVVALIIGMVFCTLFFFIGQFYYLFPGPLTHLADFVGLNSHLESLSRGVWDLRDLFYFASLIGVSLYLTVQRLITRRF